MNSHLRPRTRLLLSTMLGAVSFLPVQALAQDADESTGLEDIVVTAQKREQSVQDVPIAVTAISGDTLEANRVTSVSDLTGLAPGVTVRTSAGGSKLPSFTVRGAVSYGVVPGSDKEVSIYLDGVYISSPRGSIFELPDVQRIEMLRGPQGTLFGRNATAGAVSISTRDPSGEVGVKASATIGNYDQFRFGASVELPQVGPFSGYVSFVHNYKRGDMRNNRAGQLWNRSNSQDSRSKKILPSPEWLGTKDANTYFAALKFESGDFTTVYKYDRTEDNGTPEGTGFVGYNASAPLIGNLLTTLINSQSIPVQISPDGKRPDVVSNGWAIPTSQEVQGHSLTSTYQVNDNLSFKNIFAFRKSYLFTASPIDGFSGLTLTPQAIGPLATFIAFSTIPGLGTATPAAQGAAIQQVAAGLTPLIGSPYVGIATAPQARSKQFSDELQINYNSDFLTVTAGAVWFMSKDWTGEPYLQNTPSFAPVFGGVLPNSSVGRTFNKAESIAAYAQLEFHVTPEIDVIAGGRITHDKKSGTFTFGPSLANLKTLSFDYSKSKPNFLIGLNYKPSQDLMVYAKFSTAYVSGGAVAGIPFEPETVRSWEAGVKSELFDRKLRANLALFHATYKHFQTAQSATNFTTEITQITGDPTRAASIGTFVADQGGEVKARGFEFDLSAAPARGLTFGGSLSYTKTTFSDVSSILLTSNGGRYEPTFRPEWTGGLWAQYNTPTLGAGEAYVMFRADASWQSDMSLTQNPDLPIYAGFGKGIAEVPAYWLVNGRVALRDLDIGGVKTELAVWGKNLTNERSIAFALNLSNLIAAANYIPARTYGLDLTVQF